MLAFHEKSTKAIEPTTQGNTHDPKFRLADPRRSSQILANPRSLISIPRMSHNCPRRSSQILADPRRSSQLQVCVGELKKSEVSKFTRAAHLGPKVEKCTNKCRIYNKRSKKLQEVETSTKSCRKVQTVTNDTPLHELAPLDTTSYKSEPKARIGTTRYKQHESEPAARIRDRFVMYRVEHNGSNQNGRIGGDECWLDMPANGTAELLWSSCISTCMQQRQVNYVEEVWNQAATTTTTAAMRREAQLCVHVVVLVFLYMHARSCTRTLERMFIL